MAKKQIEKTKKKLDAGKIFTKIVCFTLAMLMILSVAISLIYNLIAM